MTDHSLTDDQLAELKEAHEGEADRRVAGRIKAVYHLGWSSRAVADALLIVRATALNHFRRYRRGGLEKLRSWEYEGSDSYLTDEEQEALKRTLEERLFLTAAEVVTSIAERWGGTLQCGKRHQAAQSAGLCLQEGQRHPRQSGRREAGSLRSGIPGTQAPGRSRRADLLQRRGASADNPVISYGWIKRTQECEILSNTSRRRSNIHGAIDVQTTAAAIRYEDWVNVDAVIRLLQDIEQANPNAPEIYFNCDNASYYRAKAVTEYLKRSRIKVIFLPSYSPNLNLIERLWKYFKRNVLCSQYYGRKFRDHFGLRWRVFICGHYMS